MNIDELIKIAKEYQNCKCGACKLEWKRFKEELKLQDILK